MPIFGDCHNLWYVSATGYILAHHVESDLVWAIYLRYIHSQFFWLLRVVATRVWGNNVGLYAKQREWYLPVARAARSYLRVA